MSCSDCPTIRTRSWIAAVLTLLGTVAAPTCASEPVRLTRDGMRKIAPTFIDGGAALVYAAHERPDLVALIQLDWHSGARERVLPRVVNHQFDPAFSADGRYLAYARTTTSPQSELVIRDRHEQRDVTFRPRDSRATVRYPSFAPDGSRIVFSLSDAGGQQVAAVDLKGRGLTILARSAGINGWPAYSPDGRRIAFASSRDGDLEVYVMDADGARIRRLTRSPGRDVRPAWSPDGKTIAFTSTRDGNEEIYLIGADGSNPRNLTNHPDRDTDPAWHPDGHRLAFVSDRGGRCELYLIDLDPLRPADSGSP
jgi:Tol biopolymer transport system component